LSLLFLSITKYRRQHQSPKMPPKRGKKRAAEDEDDNLAPKTSQKVNKGPPRKKRAASHQKLSEEEDDEGPAPSKSRSARERKSVEEKQPNEDDESPSKGKTAKPTNRQRKKKTEVRGPVQDPAIPGWQIKPVSRKGSGTSKRTMSNQSRSVRRTSVEEVFFTDQNLARLIARENQIKALRVLRTEEVTKSQPILSSENTTQAQSAPQTAPASPSTHQRLVDRLFTGIARPNRNWSCEVEEYTSPKSRAKTWIPIPRVLFWLNDNTGKSEKRWLGQLILSESMDVSLARRIAPGIANAINRFSGSVIEISHAKIPPRLQTHPVTELIFEAAIRRQNTGSRRNFPAPYFEMKDGYYYAVWRVSLIDPTTQKTWQYTGRCNATTGPESVSTPYTPGLQFHIAIVRGAVNNIHTRPLAVHQDSNGRDVHDSNMPDPIPEIPSTHLVVPWDLSISKRQACLNVEAVARTLVVATHGLEIDEPSLKALVKDLSNSFNGAPRQRAEKKNGGGKLYTPNRKVRDRSLWIKPSKKAANQIDHSVGYGKLPSIQIKSLDRTRIIPAIDALNQTWAETGDIKLAWIALAKAAYGINQAIADGSPAQAACHRSEDDQSCNLSHTCGSCGNALLCMRTIDGTLGLRVCSPCDHKDRKRYPLGLAHAVAQSSLRVLVHHELQAAGLEVTDQKAQDTFEQASQQLTALFKDSVQPGAKWIDGYSGKERIQMTEVLYGREPSAMSIDAVFAYATGPNGIVQHVKDNFALCSQAVNFAKYIHLPAWMSFLSYHLSVYDKHLAYDLSDEEWDIHSRNVIRTAKQHSAIREKARHQKLYRKKHPASEKRLTLDRHEWRSGQFHVFDKSGNKDQPWQQERNRINVQGDGRLFTSLDLRSSMRDLARKTEAEFGVGLPRGVIDDCPWFCNDDPPPGWSWNMCNSLIRAVFRRLRETCNGLDDTEDEPGCIFIEIIFIACVWIWEDKGRDAEIGKCWSYDEKLAFFEEYREFLSLPIVFSTKNPISFAVTHKRHGRPMRTGWQEQPTELEHRYNLLNNMLLETQTSNFAKSNFQTKQYDEIKQLLRDVQQNKLGPDVPDFDETGLFGQWYDSEMPQVKTVSSDLLEDLLDVDEDEAFDWIPTVDMGLPVDFDDEGLEGEGSEDSGAEEGEGDEGDDDDSDDDGDGGEQGGDGDDDGEEDDDGDEDNNQGKRSGGDKFNRVKLSVKAAKGHREDDGDEETIADLTKDFDATFEWVSTARAKHAKMPVVSTFLSDMQEAVVIPDREVYDHTKQQMLDWIKQNAPA
jgi:hypothetical protein